MHVLLLLLLLSVLVGAYFITTRAQHIFLISKQQQHEQHHALEGVGEIHGSFRSVVEGRMQYRRIGVSMASSTSESEFTLNITHRETVRAVVNALQKYI